MALLNPDIGTTFVWISLPRATLLRCRRTGSRPIRTLEHPAGIPGLSLETKTLVDFANAKVRFAALAAGLEESAARPASGGKQPRP